MAKNSVRDYSATNSSNTDIQSIDISEGCSPAGINNAIREVMVDLKNVSTGAVALETPSADQLNVDNLRLDGNTISSTDTNGDITIDPDGTGQISLSAPVEVQSTGGATPTYSHTNNGEGLTFRYNDDSGARAADIVATGNTPAGATMAMRFFTNPNSTDAAAEVMRLQDGKVGIGITPTSPLHVSSSTTGNITNVVATNTSYGNDVLQVRCARSGATTEYNNLTVFDNNTSLKMLIRANGNLLNSNNSYGSLSDQTLKENIVDSASQWDDIKAVQIRKYNFIDSDETQIGVVAQELEAAGMDGLVESVEMYSSNEEDEPVRNGEFKKSVKYSVLHMKALKALQEAMNRIETLEARLTALEAE